ncbi:hypothetical protein TTRE_0000903201 [Trichuris trichiura]|uniref:Uncharacterized protein n=1 Tax=Trichuris trichiura TaxID=36087 RepID=A0A077ZJV8_TRITR|nr:hypothetical protein TTRE_0000903201 [Trichuris trichiura]
MLRKVDLAISPSRFHKTEFFGFSLMDVRMANGLKSTAARCKPNRLGRLLQKTGVLHLLGACPTAVRVCFGHSDDIEEYGMHWNFFYTLALVQPVGELIASRF